jgi:hypothetical protein
LLHYLTPYKLKTSSSLFTILAPGFFLLILSAVLFCLPQHLSPVLVLYWSLFRTVLPPARRILTSYCTASWQTNPYFLLYCLLADESSLHTVLPPGRRILTSYCTASWQTIPHFILYCLLADESSLHTVLPPGRRILTSYCTASWQTNPHSTVLPPGRLILVPYESTVLSLRNLPATAFR